MLLQISNLYAEGISKLRRDSSWKDAKPAFTCDLWHSRCMKEYFTMTAHWIEILVNSVTMGASPTWRLAQVARQCLCVPASSTPQKGASAKWATSRSCLSCLGIRTCCNVVGNVMNTM